MSSALCRCPGSDQVLTNWEEIKRAEPGYEDRTSILDGIPPALPALTRALEVSKRVVKVGFEWPGIAEVLDKVEEEIRELRAEIASGTERAGRRAGRSAVHAGQCRPAVKS